MKSFSYENIITETYEEKRYKGAPNKVDRTGYGTVTSSIQYVSNTVTEGSDNTNTNNMDKR